MRRVPIATVVVSTMLAFVSACGSSSSDASATGSPSTTTRSMAGMHMAPGTHMDHGMVVHGQERDITYDQLPARTKAEVDQLIAAYAHKYPTGADATKDGWYKATPSLYGIGAHYTHGIGFPATPTFDLLHPNMLLYDGDGPDARFAGVSYSVSSATAPTGFAGPYDVWHSHGSVCLKGGTVVSLTEDDSDVWLSASECTARGGRVMPIPGDLMIHVWIGPGYFEAAPIFAHDNPKLYDGFLPQRDA
jgi:hypothetical protein